MPKTKSTEIVAPESQNAGVDHSIHLHSSEQMEKVLNDSVHLTVTSPPYITTLFHEGQEFNYSGFLDHYRTVVSEIYRSMIQSADLMTSRLCSMTSTE